MTEFRWNLSLTDENGMLVLRFIDKKASNNNYETATQITEETEDCLKEIADWINDLLNQIADQEHQLTLNL